MRLFALIQCAVVLSASAGTYDICDFGASTGAAPSANAASIQKAIDAAAQAGGGRVVVPAGTYTSGTLWLKRGVELHLAEGSVLKASGDVADYNAEDAYPENWGSPVHEQWRGLHFIIAREADGASITGPGTIHGNGDAFYDEKPKAYHEWMKPGAHAWWNGIRWSKDKEKLRPGQLIVFLKCRDVSVKGLTIKNSPCWSLWFWGCDGVHVSDYTVRNGENDGNSDGIDFDCSKNVVLERADIDTGDDAVAIRASARSLSADGKGRLGLPPVTENVRIRDCRLRSTSSVIRIGVGEGVIRDVAFDNVTCDRGGRAVNISTLYGAPERGGTDIERVVMRNCHFSNCRVGALVMSNGGERLEFGIRGIRFEDCSFGGLKPVVASSPNVKFPLSADAVSFRRVAEVPASFGTTQDVTDFGAKDGELSTSAIQKAIDAAAQAGGGRVVVPAGTYTSGTIWLRSHVELHLDKGAVIKGSTRQEDYNANDAFPENFWSAGEEWSGGHLVLGYKVEDVAITGEGVIDGNGPAFFGECDEDSRFPYYKYGLKLHPIDRTWFRPGHMVAFFLSKNIRLSGVTLANTPAWTTHFRCCDGLDIRGVTIDADRTIANSDGFSIDCTKNVTVAGCTVKSGDDAFALRASCKLHAAENPCENIRITDCDAWSCCYGIRFGIGTGALRNITVENCRFHESATGMGFFPAWVPGKKGVYIENIVVSNCVVRECRDPVHTRVRADDWIVRNVTFDGCRFESLLPISLDGTAARQPENITFRNCSRRTLRRVKVRNHGVGSDNPTRFINDNKVVNLRIENCRPSASPQGTLLLSFDDRNFGDWIAAMPLFEKYNAHATFFVSGPVDAEAVTAMKRLSEAGHSIGLHGLKHLNADEAVAQMGAERYFKDEIQPQFAACQVSYIPITSFAYPNCRSSEETDALFRKHGFRHVRGGHKGVAPYDPKGEKQDGLKPISAVDKVFFPSKELKSRFRYDTVIAGEAYHTDIDEILRCIRRCAERNETFVLASHGIRPDAKHIHMKTEWLERILATAAECGVAVVGFDEL